MKELPTPYSQFIHLSRYSRFNWDKNRRETWPETVSRYFDFFEKHLYEKHEYQLTEDLRKELEDAVLNLDIMPSMRALMTAGPALSRDNIAGYNCAYVPVDSPKAFDEILFILMCGTGVGFSVERQEVNKLPVIPDELYPSDSVIVVNDSKLGWAKSVKELIAMLYSGLIPKTDTSRLRKAGAPLKTFGGRSSGPEPLDRLFKFIIMTFQNAKGRRLTSVECHDIVCFIADCVVVGGVRRAALISLSNLSDDRMRNAKNGQWWIDNGQRALANNSAAYTEKPDMAIFMDEWYALYQSKSGERGIFNRDAVKKHIDNMNDFRREIISDIDIRKTDYDFGTNPCSEINLRPREFCNLTEVIARENDTVKSLRRKVELATILGTFQSTLTDFRYISSAWKKNCEEERLLGVSITGVMDCPLLNFDAFKKDKDGLETLLKGLKADSIETNNYYAHILGINTSVSITCNKPSGTVSQLVDSSSGIHTRHSPYYIRSVRNDMTDPMTKLMVDQGIPHEPDITKPDHVMVFYFPIKSPENAIFRNDMTAIDQLNFWMTYSKNWTEHKPSVTISVKEHEWLAVGAWVYEHFDDMSGVSFLPYSDHVYQQAPYQDCTKEEYEELLNKMPDTIDWSVLSNYENGDQTEGAAMLACSAGVCEI